MKCWGQLSTIKYADCFNVTIGYAKDKKGRAITDNTLPGSTVAKGNKIDVTIYKEFGQGVYNYGLIAHELDHVHRYFTGELVAGDDASYTKEDEYEAYKKQIMLLNRASYFDDKERFERQAFNLVNNNYSGAKEGFATLQWAGPPPFGSTGNIDDHDWESYGSSGIISTGYNGDIYWENYYVYEENGMYNTTNGPLTDAWGNYSTGYTYSTGNNDASTGNESTGD